MALIESGSIRDFDATLEDSALSPLYFNKVRDLEQMKRTYKKKKIRPKVSEQNRGLTLRTLSIKKNFDGFLGGLFDKNNEIYFFSYAWDLSGSEPFANNNPDNYFTMKEGEEREFMGAGKLLYPMQKVHGGVNLEIKIFESDKKTRDIGQIMQTIGETIQTSELSSLLNLISIAGGIEMALLSSIRSASAELSSIIGSILKGNSDDYVDYYSGYFPAGETWKTVYDTPFTSIELTELK